MIDIIIYFLFVSSLTSMLLYSDLFKIFREWWFKKFKGKLLESLLICSLCASFHIGYLTQWLFLPFNGFIKYFILSIAASGFSWLLCSFTLMCLNIKYLCEYMARED